MNDKLSDSHIGDFEQEKLIFKAGIVESLTDGFRQNLAKFLMVRPLTKKK